jgi:hypothetical protein
MLSLIPTTTSVQANNKSNAKAPNSEVQHMQALMNQTSPLHAYYVIGVALSRDALWGHIVQHLEGDMVSLILYYLMVGGP